MSPRTKIDEASPPLALRLANNLVGARESCFCDSIGVLGIVRVLNDRVTRPCHHFFSPRSDERKLSILLGNYHEAHLYTARSVRQPTVGPRADWPFISSREGISDNKYLLVSGFRTAISNDHVAKLRRTALRLLASPLIVVTMTSPGVAGRTSTGFVLRASPAPLVSCAR